MYKIIDIPYGTYLGQVTDISAVKIKDKDYVQLQTEIVFGEWHDYFGAATKAKNLVFPKVVTIVLLLCKQETPHEFLTILKIILIGIKFWLLSK